MKLLIINLIIVLAYVVNTINAVHFKVICAPYDHGGTGVNVNIDGTSYQMQSYNNDIIYEYEYDGTPNNYYYEIIGVPEQNESILFNGVPRTWDPNSTTTLYEIFGREHTLGDNMIQTLPRYAKPLKGYNKYSQLYQEGELPVINVHMSEENYNELISLTSRKEIEYIIEFDLITPYEKYHFTNARFSLSGQGSRNQDKKPYKIDLSSDETDKTNSEIFKRKEFKLRSLRFDTSYIKNKLASDIAQSIGLPVTQSTLCRLYINNKSYGLYEISDLYKKKFVKHFFDPPLDTEQKPIYGTLYKGVSGLDDCGYNFPAYFYSEPDQRIRDLYECIVAPTAGYDTHQDVITFINWLESLPEGASKQQIEEKVDLDTLLKNAAFEYLICHWDGFLGNGNNFFLYAEPDNGKYHIFSYDFDLALGKYCTAQPGDLNTYITTLEVNRKYDCDKDDGRKPLLYNKILNNPEIKPLLDDLIKDIVENLFNPRTLEQRINYYYQYYKTDMYWDIFCRKIIQTQNFNTEEAVIPTEQLIEKEYSSTDDIDYLYAYINGRIPEIARAYGANIPRNAIIEGNYGTVGNKLMTLETDDKNDDDKKNDDEKLTNSTTTNYAMTLLSALISFIFVWMTNLN